MSFCPKCGTELKDKPSFCPACGYSLKQSPFSKDKIILASRANGSETTGTGWGVILIIIGIFFSPLLLGIILIVSGATIVSEAGGNAKNKHECMSYETKTRKVVVYSYDGFFEKYDLSQIVDVKRKKSKILLVYVQKKKRTYKIRCGYTTTPLEQIQNSLTNLKKWEEKIPK